MYIRFAYDPAKGRKNFRDHGVSFEEAITTFYDENARAEPDVEHSSPSDERYVNVGFSTNGRLLFVVHNEADGLIRLIHARVASPAQRALYEEG